MLRQFFWQRFRCLAVIATLALGLPGSNALAQDDSEKMTAEDVERLIKESSNWGRWGKEDQLGTLNLITPKKRMDAAKLVLRGLSVSLARDAETKEALDNPRPFGHKMLATGLVEGQWAMDNYEVSYHGLAHTHMDSLCHLFFRGRMYNGFSREEVGEAGAARLSIDNVKTGIFTRGLLVDVPRLRGVKYLKPGEPIFPADLAKWEKTTGLKVKPGDVVFIRTGRWACRADRGPWDPSVNGMSGLHASCATWLKQGDIAMLGSDAAADVIPSGIEGVTHPIHVLTLHAMGVHIFDNCDLEDLGKTCAKLKQWEFLITASPIPVKGGTGSPLNPIATF
jgi:kynurenine formamidase